LNISNVLTLVYLTITLVVFATDLNKLFVDLVIFLIADILPPSNKNRFRFLDEVIVSFSLGDLNSLETLILHFSPLINLV